MTYRDHLRALGDQTADRVVAIFESWREGLLDTEEAEALIAAIVARANGRAVTLADLSLASTLMIQTGEARPVLGLAPAADDLARLQTAATTLLAIEDVTVERVARLGRSEPLEAAARAYSEGIAATPDVSGWVRDTGGDPCQLCRWWSREGRVWPDDHPMPTHKGCTCTPVPVTK